jgi:hypothetical protein
MLQDVYGEELSYSLDLISGLPGLSLARKRSIQLFTSSLDLPI